MSKKWFAIVVVLGIALSLAITFFAWGISIQNKAINLEEQINESYSAVDIQEKRRVDLIFNLVDTVQEYDKHEKETLIQLTEARSKASSGDIDEARLAIDAVAEAYPELKSIDNYQTLMNELAVTENLITEYRNNFNIQVRSYNKHVRVFPNKQFLSVFGYEQIESNYLEYNAPSDAPQDIFKEGG